MNGFIASFNGTDWLCTTTGQRIPIAFNGFTGEDFTLNTSTWTPEMASPIKLTAALGIVASSNTPARVTLTLLKNGAVRDTMSVICGKTMLEIGFTANDNCKARQSRDNKGHLLFDSNGKPVYDSNSLDKYQLTLTTSTALRVLSPLVNSRFAGSTA